MGVLNKVRCMSFTYGLATKITYANCPEVG